MRNGIKIALPLEEFCAPAYWHLWMHLSYKEFLEKFGYDVWDQYNIPTEEEVARLERAEQYGRTSEDVESVYSYDEEEMEKFLEEDGEDVDSEAEYQSSEGSEADLAVRDLTTLDLDVPMREDEDEDEDEDGDYQPNEEGDDESDVDEDVEMRELGEEEEGEDPYANLDLHNYSVMSQGLPSRQEQEEEIDENGEGLVVYDSNQEEGFNDDGEEWGGFSN